VKVTFAVSNLSNFHTAGKWQVLAMVCLHVNEIMHVTCNFNCLIETEGLLKVTASHKHSEGGNISEMVQHRNVVSTDH